MIVERLQAEVVQVIAGVMYLAAFLTPEHVAKNKTISGI